MAQKGQEFALMLAAPGAGGAVPTTFTEIGFTKSKSLTRAMETIDTTSDTDAGWKTTLAGQRSWGAEGALIYKVANAGHTLLDTAYNADDAYRLRLIEVTRNAGTGVATQKAGGVVYEGWARITKLDLEAGVNEVFSGTISFEGTGPVTLGTVA